MQYSNGCWYRLSLNPALGRRTAPAQVQLLKQAVKNLNPSATAYDRILRVARTIADLP